MLNGGLIMTKRLAFFVLFGFVTLGTIAPGAIETIYSASHSVQGEPEEHGGSKGIAESMSARKTEASNGIRYELDASHSRVMVDANAAGLLWFLGHNHHVAAREFS